MIGHLVSKIHSVIFRRGPSTTEIVDPKVISFVGNGNVDPKFSSEIDSSDLVIRFNGARNCGVAGRKTDILVLVNWSYRGNEIARSPRSVNRIARRSRSFLLTTKPEDQLILLNGREDNSLGDATPAILRSVVKGRPYGFMPLSNRRETERLLREHGAPPDVCPSTGAQAIHYFRSMYPSARIRLYGFSHKGWEGHCWEAERKWVAAVLMDQESRLGKLSGND